MASKCLKERPQALFTLKSFLVFFSLLSSLELQFVSNAGLFHRLPLAPPVGLAFVQSVFELTVFALSCRLRGIWSIENTGGRVLEPALCSEPLQSFSILQAKFKGIRNCSPSWIFLLSGEVTVRQGGELWTIMLAASGRRGGHVGGG